MPLPALFADPLLVRLPGELVVRLGPVTPADRGRIRRALAELSDQSRYLRFFTTFEGFSDQQLRYLTDVDQTHHLALGVADPARSGEPGLGAARCVKLPEEPEVAEAAITVVDAVQHRGLGTILFAALALCADANGIRTFRAYVLRRNVDVIRPFASAHVPVQHLGDGMLQYDVPVIVDPDDPGLGDEAGLFRHALRTFRRAAAARPRPPEVNLARPAGEWDGCSGPPRAPETGP